MATFPRTEPQIAAPAQEITNGLTANGAAHPAPAAACRVQRRERPSGPWSGVATTIDSEIMLTDQTRAKELEYWVIAINRAGHGQPSNTAMVVL